MPLEPAVEADAIVVGGDRELANVVAERGSLGIGHQAMPLMSARPRNSAAMLATTEPIA